MISSPKRTRITSFSLALTLALSVGLAGCRSAQDKANDAALAQAEQIAAQTGTAQRVTWTDAHSNSVTSIVQPPAPGATQQQITTSTLSTKTSDGATTQSTTTRTRMVPLTHAPALPQGGSSVANGTPVIAPASNAGYPTRQGGAGYGSGPDSGSANPQTGPYAQSQNPGGSIRPAELDVPRGTTLSIRINQHIGVRTSRVGEGFSGEVVRPVYVRGSNDIAIPERTPVFGVVDAAHRRGRFKGRSILELRLTAMELNGQRYALDTSDDVRTKKGKGKRTAALIGGGAGLGMLVGGVASGGVGLLVGGLAGGGAGTAVSAFTGNRDIEIPAESVMDFRLADDLVLQPR